MSKRILLISLLVIGLIFAASTVFAQTLPAGYDEDEEVATISRSDEGAGTTFVQDLEEIRRRRINDIIQKIRQGDPNVLRFIVYDVMEEVHTEVIRRAREGNTSYYAVLNWNNAIPAYIGGFDNQDPKVRLRCIGWLGDWVDEIGTDLADIRKRTRDRIVSRIETREEVKYALHLLNFKIVRKTYLNAIYQGDETALKTINALEFLVLVHNELFLREVLCIPRRVKIRSIRLAPWWIDVRALMNIVAERLEMTRQLNRVMYDRIYTCDFCSDLGDATSARAGDFTGFIFSDDDLMNEDEERADKQTDDDLILPLLPTGYEVYRIKTKDDVLEENRQRGDEFEKLETWYYGPNNEQLNFYGYIDHAGNWDIQTLYDIRYFNYSADITFPNEDRYIRAIFMGLANRHLVVRENVARVLVMLSDPFVKLDLANRVIGVDGMLNRLAKESKYVETLINAWEEVRFAQFVDVARPTMGLGDTLVYYNLDGTLVDYGARYAINNQTNPWRYCWNYRIDIHELLRRMGFGHLFACELEEVVQIEVAQEEENTYFVESLFDLSEIDIIEQGDPGIFELIPEWHGVDEIEDEIFNPITTGSTR
jgi:hypothetical protein